jgi:hypothetical protein
MAAGIKTRVGTIIQPISQDIVILRVGPPGKCRLIYGPGSRDTYTDATPTEETKKEEKNGAPMESGAC